MTPRIPPQAAPRILLVEDDPASRAFLSAAASTLPARVTEASGCAEARALVAAGAAFDLWLVDAQLQDGDGVALLGELRAMHPGTPALAHTAAREPGVPAALRAAGFDAVVVKPLPAAALRDAVRALLGDGCGDWDDGAALDALNGNAEHVQGLRRLFLAELPAQAEAVAGALAAGDTAGAGAVLHRLRASCGFVGATRLGDAGALARFQAAVRALLR